MSGGANPPACANCDGIGTVPGLLHGAKFECYLCHGTGYDLTDPVLAIKHLQAEHANLNAKYKSLLWRARRFFELWTAEEIEARRADVANRYIQEHHSSRFD